MILSELSEKKMFDAYLLKHCAKVMKHIYTVKEKSIL
jgi:hypothetical protein